jgi:hypothetical protein
MENNALIQQLESVNNGISASSSPLRSAPPAMVMSSPIMPQMVEMPYDPLQQQEQPQQPNGGASDSYSTLGWLSLLAVTVGGGFMAGRKSAKAAPTRSAVISMATVGETCNTLAGPDIMWGPDGPLQSPMKEESDIRGQDAYKKFAAACASNGVDLNQPDITVFVPTDLVIDDFEAAGGVLTADVCNYHVVRGVVPKASFSSAEMLTMQGGKLTHRRMFRKDFIDDATPGVASEGASKSASYPSDIACDNGLMHVSNLVLKPGWTEVDEGGTR